MYARGMTTLILGLCLAIAGAWLAIAGLLGAFSPVSPTELNALGPFTHIHLTAAGEMEIVQSGAASVAIDANPRDLRRLRVYVNEGTLYIEHRNDWLDRFAPTGEPVRYHVNVDRLDTLSLAGVARVETAGLTADAFALSLRGSGAIVMENLDVERLEVDMTGGGEATLSGIAVDQALSIAGAGRYVAGDLRAETARVQLSGVSAATLWVTLALDAEITGSGRLSYYGNPTVTRRLSGLGGIEKLGPR